MLLSVPDLRFGLEKAEEVKELYRLYVLNSGARRKSMDGLLQICGDGYLSKKIKQFDLTEAPQQDSIRGFCVSFGDRYEIGLLPGMNLCWRRYVLTKEIFHAILDEDRYRTTELYSHIEEALAKYPVPVLAGSAVVSEALAELAAMEFLFPHSDRVAMVSNGTPDYMAIAERYKVPRVAIEEYLVPAFVKVLDGYMPKKPV